ncbi:hypothetical protein BDZ89DRAFT_1090669 [Hymenopellis radicata]|nr:hypothetical protein BDZ89DRAFT_1090669 [Hymenopellis radicata]
MVKSERYRENEDRLNTLPSKRTRKLEQHLASRSYVEGYTPSQADVLVFNAIKAGEIYPNVARWYNHIHRRNLFELGWWCCPAAKAADDDDDEVDLFGDDDEEDDAEAERVKAERVAAYNAKKANKPKTIAKSVVTMDIKPWDDETDMKALEEAVRSIEQPGLVWGASKLVAIGYEDELVSTDELQEKIAEFEDYVQSTDIAAMQSKSLCSFLAIIYLLSCQNCNM